MATEAQIAANRRNAQRSSGPKSSAGKARVARNATWHSLAARIVAGTPATERVRQVADAMIGNGPRTEASEAFARIAAEAQQTIEQVAGVRASIFELTQPTVRSYRRTRVQRVLVQIKRNLAGLKPEAAELVGKQTIQSFLDLIAFKEAEESLWQPETETERQVVVLQEVAARLLRLDRYERRALSRRRRALLELDELRQAAASNRQKAREHR
jgi:hypothetical protein